MPPSVNPSDMAVPGAARRAQGRSAGGRPAAVPLPVTAPLPAAKSITQAETARALAPRTA